MRLVAAPDRTAVAQHAADVIERFVSTGAPTALGIATGTTMEEPLDEIARRHRRGSLSLALTEVYLLDEYVGLEPSDHCAFRKFIDRRLVRQTDLRPDAVHSPDPHAPDLDAECNRYEHDVRNARVGLQLLGIGANGHIAFNEPGSAFTSTTRVVRLSEQTRCDNARFFPHGIGPPATAITQGIDTILAAGELLLVACGEHKAVAVSRALEGPATVSVPASAIQLHPKVTVIVDSGAASLLQGAPSRHLEAH